MFCLDKDCASNVLGTWGVDPLANDDAQDWLANFREQPTITELRNVFAAINFCDFADSVICNEALAAAQYITSSMSPRVEHASLQWEEAQEFFRELSVEGKIELRDAAVAAVIRIKAVSELRDLWSENSLKLLSWENCLDCLLNRLKKFGA